MITAAWILILVFSSSDGAAMTSTAFADRTACEIAREELHAAAKGTVGRFTVAVCVPSKDPAQ